MGLSYSEFETILKNNGYGKGDFVPGEKQYVYNYFRLQGMTYSQVRSIISGARKKVLWETEGKKGRVHVKLLELIQEKCTAIDIAMYDEIFAISKEFKNYYIKNKIATPQLDKLISKCLRATKKINGAVTAEVLEIAQEDLEVLHNLACIYTAISEHIKNEPITKPDPDVEGRPLTEFARTADYIVGTRLGRMKDIEYLRKSSIRKQFAEFLDALAHVDESISQEEVFTQDEIKQILVNTTSMIKYSTAEKVNALRDIIAMYKQEIAKVANTTEEERNALAKVTAKSMILHAGTIMQASPDSLKDCVNFFLGKDMKTILHYVTYPYENTDKQNLRYVFPDLKVHGMTTEHHLYLLNNNISLFTSLKLPTIYSVASGLTDCVYQALGGDDSVTDIVKKKEAVEQAGFDTNALFTGDNLVDTLNSTVATIFNDSNKVKERQNIVNNMRLMLKYVSVADMQQMMQHNYLLFLQDNKKVEKKIATIIENADGNLELFTTNFNKYINSKFPLPNSTNTRSKKTAKTEVAAVSEDVIEDEIEQNSKDNYVVSKENVEVDKFNLENLPELASGVIVLELKEIIKYLRLPKSEVKHYISQAKPSIAKDLAEAKEGVYIEKGADKMNLGLMGNRASFAKRLKKLVEACKDLDKDSSLRGDILALIDEIQHGIEGDIDALEEDIQISTEYTDEFYKDERSGKKARNKGVNIEQANKEMQTILEMFDRKDSIIHRLASIDVLEEEIDKLADVQDQAKKYAQERAEVKDWNEHAYVLKNELAYLKKLNSVLAECEGLVSVKEDTDQDVVEEIVEEDELGEIAYSNPIDNMDVPTLIREIESTKYYITQKRKEIQSKFKGKKDIALKEHKHGRRLQEQLDKAEAKLAMLQNRLHELTNGQGQGL